MGDFDEEDRRGDPEFEGESGSEEDLEDESNHANEPNVTPRAAKVLAETDMNGSNTSKKSKSENRIEKSQSIGSKGKTKLDCQSGGSKKTIEEDETAVKNCIDINNINKPHSTEEAKNY